VCDFGGLASFEVIKNMALRKVFGTERGGERERERERERGGG
jgi:hypothetical protein